MPISSEELLLGREAQKRVEDYRRGKSKRLAAYLIPMCWLAGSIVQYEVRANIGYIFQILFWAIALMAALAFEHKSKKVYSRDLATLETLRKQYGFEVSFEEGHVAPSAGETAIKDRAKWKGLEPLFAFAVFLAAVFTMTHLVHLLLPHR